MAEASAQQAQQQAREDSRKKNLTLRKARKAAKGAEEKLAQGQHAEALSRFKISYKVFGEAGIDHVKIREKIIALDPGWNPAKCTADGSPDGAATGKLQRQPHRSDADSAGRGRSAEVSPVKKLDISSELADREAVPTMLGGERGWADYTPPSSAKSSLGNVGYNGSSPSLLQRVQQAGKRVQQNEASPAAASSTRAGTFLYSAVSPAATGSVDGESHLMSVRPVGDQQASALRPPRARPSSQRSSRSPPQTRPGSGQKIRDSMPTSATPYTTPRAGGSSSMFVPSAGSRAQAARYSREYDYSGRHSASTYRHRSPSPSATGHPGWRGTSPFDKRKQQELSVKFDWSAALVSSEKLFHRIRVSLPSDDSELRSTRPEPSWSSAVSQQVLFHGIGEQDVAFSFVDDEEDECRITSEDEWLAALRIQAAKGGPLRVRVESLAFSEHQELHSEDSTGMLKIRTLGATVVALIASGFAAWHLQRIETMVH